jgi:hypothetical protein
VGEFIVIRVQPYHQSVIINIDAIALIRPKSGTNGSTHMEIVMTSGVAIATEMTFDDLVARLRAEPAGQSANQAETPGS